MYGLPTFLIFFCFNPSQAGAVLSFLGKRFLNRRPENQRKVKQGGDRCVVEERKFGSEAELKFGLTSTSEKVSAARYASVGAVFSESKRKFVIDFTTFSETRTSKRRPWEFSKWTKLSRTNTLWWVPEPAGLPFTRYLPDTEGLGCEETIIEWGKALLKKRRVSKASAVLAVSRKALKEARNRESGEDSTFSYAFGPSEALLPSAITYFRDDRLNRSTVNFIKFVDYTIPGGTIELPLLGKNLDIMRAWMLPEENDANLTDPILDTAAAWGIDTEEEGISEVEMETRLSAVIIAVAAGWNERLAPGK
ncbi:hypothetical protein FOZ62_025975 [Perkinsus olseni]|uniref:Uncharacterized protein n=1 Tax=Perkinsus olseni TaxID=32597 RepID=A0A7J6PW56_PEROL|nr:hypothetical protein FOZ62_025975 [Perkinsus olseni]